MKGDTKKKYFSIISRKEWMDDCCWAEINYYKNKNGGYTDGKMHICRECENKIITERRDIVKEHGDID